ncbi:MAG: hypothetical protein R3C40_02910 [Parvularculaceae bacterium]
MPTLPACRLADVYSLSAFADVYSLSAFADVYSLSAFADVYSLSAFADVYSLSAFADVYSLSAFADGRRDERRMWRVPPANHDAATSRRRNASLPGGALQMPMAAGRKTSD